MSVGGFLKMSSQTNLPMVDCVGLDMGLGGKMLNTKTRRRTSFELVAHYENLLSLSRQRFEKRESMLLNKINYWKNTIKYQVEEILNTKTGNEMETELKDLSRKRRNLVRAIKKRQEEKVEAARKNFMSQLK